MLAGIFYGAQYGRHHHLGAAAAAGQGVVGGDRLRRLALAKKGKAGTALGIAAIGSFIGGTVSIIGLTIFAPIVAGFALDFGPPEYAALGVLGVLLVATVGNGHRTQGHHRGVHRAADRHRRA